MKNSDILFTCCHCNEHFIINTQYFNCNIIRHGVYKKTLVQINPHSSRSVCDELLENNKIIGCGKPLKIVKNEDTWVVEICDYI
jgi:hypothetical protein